MIVSSCLSVWHQTAVCDCVLLSVCAVLHCCMLTRKQATVLCLLLSARVHCAELLKHKCGYKTHSGHNCKAHLGPWLGEVQRSARP